MRGNVAISMVLGLFSGEAGFWASRLKRKLLFLSIAGFLLVTAWAVGVVAVVIAIAAETDPLTATMLVAAVLAATALMLIAVMMIIDRRALRKARLRQSKRSLYATTAALTLPAIVRSKPLLSVALVAGGGLLLAKALGVGGFLSGDVEDEE
nr:hypothetical protein [Pseudohoeflea sp. DP4N28-3]